MDYKPDWEKEWPWLLFRDGKGMFCSVCIKYNARSHSKSGIWVSEPCTQFRNDKVKSILVLTCTREQRSKRPWLQ